VDGVSNIHQHAVLSASFQAQNLHPFSVILLNFLVNPNTEKVLCPFPTHTFNRLLHHSLSTRKCWWVHL